MEAAAVGVLLCLRVPPGHGKSWQMKIMSWNFYYCTEQFCKSDNDFIYKVKL